MNICSWTDGHRFISKPSTSEVLLCITYVHDAKALFCNVGEVFVVADNLDEGIVNQIAVVTDSNDDVLALIVANVVDAS